MKKIACILLLQFYFGICAADNSSLQLLSGWARFLWDSKPTVPNTARMNQQLIEAAANNNRDEIERLLTIPEVDVNAISECRQTALMWAARKGHIIVIALLLNAGADKEMVARNNKSAEQFARDAGHEEVADFIQHYGPVLIKSAGKR